MRKIRNLVVIAAVLAAAALVARSPQEPQWDAEELRHAADGAFQDGLYVGQWTAENRREARPPVGRWASEQERASFVEGYRRGYAKAGR